jgi:hypothetical protein
MAAVAGSMDLWDVSMLTLMFVWPEFIVEERGQTCA